MNLLNRLKISTKVFVGFAVVLSLLVVIVSVSLYSLVDANRTFVEYRSLALQTNAEGRVQANMLMTRLHAKAFEIEASMANIQGVSDRAKNTQLMISEARKLTTHPGYQLILDNLDRELADYLESFDRVAELQFERDVLVNDQISVLGAELNSQLSSLQQDAITRSSLNDAVAAGLALQTLLQTRLNIARYLDRSDEASYQRSVADLNRLSSSVEQLDDPDLSEQQMSMVRAARNDVQKLSRAFESVHQVASERDGLIENKLNDIGPKVADQVERLKLAIKGEQDLLGPAAEAGLYRALLITVTASLVSITLGVFAAWFIGFGISRPIRQMATSMRELASGNLNAEFADYQRDDEIREMAEAVSVFRSSMIRVRELANEQRQAADQIRAAKDLAEEANKAKSAFLANMSHELRTPMNAIIGYSEMLLEEAVDAEATETVEDLEKILNASRHLLSLINDVLDLSKVEAGKMEVVGESTNVDDFVRNVVDTVGGLIGQNDNKLVVEADDALGNIYQDVTKLRQSVLNLLSNAAKFTRHGIVTLQVSRQLAGNTEMLRIAVTDNGIGIPDDRLDSVFEEFTQAEVTTGTKYGGTGLGLAISRRFCRLMGGDLTVTSELGQGSVFTIEVPVELASTDNKEVQPTPDQPASPGRAAKVLVIDDEAHARELVTRHLEKHDIEVTAAASALEGLALAKQIEPALILLDVVMQGIDGWEVLRQLKADPALRDIPVVMLTVVDDKSQAFSLGATDYLSKPVDRDHLVSIARRYSASAEASRILLVEDEPDSREVIVRMLTDADDSWQIEEAANGLEALAIIDQQPPDLILLDLMMPVMDGFEFLRELRARPAGSDINVVVITSKDLTQAERATLNERVVKTLSKSATSADDLATVVTQMLERT